MLEIRVTTDHKRWNAWLHQRDVPPFTQSAEWATILAGEGKQVELLEMYDTTAKVAQALIVYQALPFGWRYAFCPRGPVVAREDQESAVYEALEAYGRSKHCLFIRVEPAHLPLLSAAKKVIDINPRATVLIDLQQPLDQLMNAMHQKTRYNIRLAEKKEVTISETKDEAVLFDLLYATGKRDGFTLHSRGHYEAIIQSPLSSQLTVMLGKKPVATAVFVSCGNTHTYLYGASDYEHRALMAPYLLQWAALRHGQEKGCRWYDLFGIAPVTMQDGTPIYDTKHQYAGVTRFKLGFGGRVTEAPGTYDLLISPAQYKLYELIRRIRRVF